MRAVYSFLSLAFGIAWTFAGVGALFGVDVNSGSVYVGMAAACMLAPAIAAVIQVRWVEREPWTALGLDPRKIRWPFLIRTTVIGALIVPATLLVLWCLGDVFGLQAFGHVSVSGERFSIAVGELLAELGGGAAPNELTSKLAGLPGSLILLVLIVSAVVMAFSFNLPFMLGEELGWRGYLFQALQTWHPAQRVLFTGVVWGLWHAPLIAMGHNYPGYPVLGIGLMVVFCVLLSFLFDWARSRAESVWAPCVLHGMINGTAGAMALFAWDGSLLYASVAGLGGAIAIAVLVLAVVLGDPVYRKRLFATGTTDI